MKEAHNKNIRKIDLHFRKKLQELKSEINAYEELCEEKKKAIGRLQQLRENETDNYEKTRILLDLNAVENDYETTKEKKKSLVEQYKQVRSMHKTIQRAIEERFADGFVEGVRQTVKANKKRIEIPKSYPLNKKYSL